MKTAAHLSFLLAASFATLAQAEEAIVLKKTATAVEVYAEGKLFTRYIFSGAPKPYLYPIFGPTGKAMTRAYPMEKVAGETADHPHQRSLWFTHGSVNGVDFWSEDAKAGKQVQRELKLIGTDRIATTNDWLTVDGKKICEDARTLKFSASENARIIDAEWAIRASEGALTFGDTKEGSFGIRVADSMMVDRKAGHIENSRGDRDATAWGKRAEWVDYYGTVDGEILGIAILDHPKNFRHPTYWHVRTYGLFAVNPFGIHDFVKGEKAGAGNYTVAAGDTLTLRYRIIFHKGNTSDAKIADAWKEYSAK